MALVKDSLPFLPPNLFKCLGDANDRGVLQMGGIVTGPQGGLTNLQNGISCLTIIIHKDIHSLLLWKNSNGCSGLDYILELIAKMLETQDDVESGRLIISELIIHFLLCEVDMIILAEPCYPICILDLQPIRYSSLIH